jgi:5-methylcytosine-specific restriction endonuclease McrA
VELARRGAAASTAAAPGSPRPPFRVVLHRCDTCGEATREARAGPESVAPETAARARCDAEVVDARAPARIAATIPPRVRRHVLARDRHRCAVPGCSGRDFVEVHHVVPRARGGDHDPRRLVTLCESHHAAVHRGELRIEGQAPRLAFIAVASREGLSERARQVLARLVAGPMLLDDLIDASGAPAGHVIAAVGELSLAGLATRRGCEVAAYAA